MKVTGKHFPGHGVVITDSHKAIATYARSRSEIEYVRRLERLNALKIIHIAK